MTVVPVFVIRAKIRVISLFPGIAITTPSYKLVVKRISQHAGERQNTDCDGCPDDTPERSLVPPGEDIADELPDASKENGEPHSE